MDLTGPETDHLWIDEMRGEPGAFQQNIAEPRLRNQAIAFDPPDRSGESAEPGDISGPTSFWHAFGALKKIPN